MRQESAIGKFARHKAEGASHTREEYERKFVAREQSRQHGNAGPISYTRYMNMGYWKDGAQTVDEAGEALVRLVAEVGEFSSGERLLDVGCGLAEQDFFWIGHFGVDRITAIDINPDVIEIASERAEKFGLSERLELQLASAVKLPFSSNAFDKVASVEAAFQFLTREDFFREAYRVLRPGGRLVTADLIAMPGRKVSDPRVNSLNMYSRDIYAEKLSQIGFTNISISSIREQVIKPFTQFRERHETSGGLRALLIRYLRRYHTSRLDYIVATAEKPLG
ncbi:MAG: methyltransferase domain-containing protein [Acidobacteria bacterium]|nr:methyltransferase domain-containing protein [Acidobacteriota bacterium]